jgi:hypothetical protein
LDRYKTRKELSNILSSNEKAEISSNKEYFDKLSDLDAR